MRSLRPLGMLVTLTFFGTKTANAADLGRLPGLQAGSAGQSIALSEIIAPEVALNFGSQQDIGSFKAGSDRIDGVGINQSLQISMAHIIDKEVRFFAYGNSSFSSYKQSHNDTAGSELTSDSSRFEVGGGPTIRTANYILGAHTGIISFGHYERRLQDLSGQRTLQADGGALPVITGYVGRRLQSADVVFSYRTFNSLPTKGIITDAAGVESRFDTDMKEPSEARIDGKWFFRDDLILASTIKLRLLGQASGGVTDLAFAADGTVTHYAQENALAWDFGGVLKPQPWIGFVGAVHWTQASYASPENASIELNNLGGTAIDIGAVTYGDIGQLFFNLGYKIPAKFDFQTDENNPESWSGQSRATELQNYGWDLKVGAALYY